MIPVLRNQLYLCQLCGSRFDDPAKHVLLHCRGLNVKRNILFEKLIDILSVDDSHWLFSQDDDIILQTLIGKRTGRFWNIEDATWIGILCTIAESLNQMDKKSKWKLLLTHQHNSPPILIRG